MSFGFSLAEVGDEACHRALITLGASETDQGAQNSRKILDALGIQNDIIVESVATDSRRQSTIAEQKRLAAQQKAEEWAVLVKFERESREQALSDIDDQLFALEHLEVQTLNRPKWNHRRYSAMRVVLALEPITRNERIPELLADYLVQRFRGALGASDFFNRLNRQGINEDNFEEINNLTDFLVWLIGGVSLDWINDDLHLAKVSQGLKISTLETQLLLRNFSSIYSSHGQYFPLTKNIVQWLAYQPLGRDRKSSDLRFVLMDAMVILLMDYDTSSIPEKIMKWIPKRDGFFASTSSLRRHTSQRFERNRVNGRLHDWTSLPVSAIMIHEERAWYK